MNNVVYHIASFMIVRNPIAWRWSHARHHTDTIIVCCDPETAAMRPPAAARMLLNFIELPDMYAGINRMLLSAFGKLDPEEATFIPDNEAPKVLFVARVWTAIYVATITLAVATQSILPLMVIGFPRLYGAWHFIMTGYLQHAGLADNVLDHRLNSRTVLMNPISRFIYWNMNYHIGHHMFPMVPFNRLPELHERIKGDLPAPNTSIWQAYKQVWPVLVRQLRYKDDFLHRDLPTGAKPYREDFHASAFGVPAE